MLTSLMIITLSLSLGACGSDDGGANTPDAGDLRDVGTDAEDPGDAEDPEDTEDPDDTGDCDVCTPGTSRCTDEGAQSCVSLQGCAQWADPVACQDGLTCSGHQCRSSCQDACTEGELRCDGEGACQTCKQQSTGCLDGSATESCGESLTCDEGISIDCFEVEERCQRRRHKRGDLPERRVGGEPVLPPKLLGRPVRRPGCL